MEESKVTYVIARSKNGLGLAQLVKYDGDQAVIRRLKGQIFRQRNPQAYPPVTVPRGDVVREATERELRLGHPA